MSSNHVYYDPTVKWTCDNTFCGKEELIRNGSKPRGWMFFSLEVSGDGYSTNQGSERGFFRENSGDACSLGCMVQIVNRALGRRIAELYGTPKDDNANEK